MTWACPGTALETNAGMCRAAEKTRQNAGVKAWGGGLVPDEEAGAGKRMG